MFDIGFSELVLIMIVGLIVLGPKRMPVAIRTVMGWISTIRGLAANVQNELAQELKLQELKDSIKKAEELKIGSFSPELGKTVEDLKMSANQLQESLNAAKNQFDQTVSIPKLSDEQVAEIQQKIEQEHQELESENTELAADQIAELAEMESEEASMESFDELSAYYPPDDELATPVESSDKVGRDNV